MTAAGPAPTRTALLLGFATIYVVWGSTYLAIRVAVGTIPPFLMAGSRFLVSGLLLYGWLRLTRGIRPTPRQWRDAVVTGALLLLGGNGLVAWAEERIASGIATLIISVGPLFIVLLEWALASASRDPARGTRPTAATFGGLALGFAGLALLVGPDLSRGAGALDPWRVGGLVVACLSWGLGTLYTRYARDQAEPLVAAAQQQLTGSGWLLLASLGLGEPLRFAPAAVSPASILAWTYLVLVGSLVGFTTFVWLTKHSPPARVATYAYVNPVVAVFLGWLILDEPLSPRVFLAAAVIIAGVALITATRNRRVLATPPRQAVACATPASASR